MTSEPEIPKGTGRPTSSRTQLDRTMIVEGVHWRVFERESTYDRRRPVLVFESLAITRFVRDYPANWATLSDEELYALS